MKSMSLPYNFTRGRLLEVYQQMDCGPTEEIEFSGPAPEGMSASHDDGKFCGIPWVSKGGMPRLTVRKKR